MLGALDEPPEKIASKFDIKFSDSTKLLLYLKCGCTIEEDSAVYDMESSADLYLFNTGTPPLAQCAGRACRKGPLWVVCTPPADRRCRGKQAPCSATDPIRLSSVPRAADLCISVNALGFSSKRVVPLTDIYGLMKSKQQAGGEGSTRIDIQCKSLSLALSIRNDQLSEATQVGEPAEAVYPAPPRNFGTRVRLEYDARRCAHANGDVDATCYATCYVMPGDCYATCYVNGDATALQCPTSPALSRNTLLPLPAARPWIVTSFLSRTSFAPPDTVFLSRRARPF